jgi:hypothetical protein
MECRFVQTRHSRCSFTKGALNTVGIDLGIFAGGVLG